VLLGHFRIPTPNDCCSAFSALTSLGFVTAVDQEKSALKHKKRKHSFQLHFMLPSSMTSTALLVLVLVLLPVTVFLQNLFSTVETS
jgi:uncharacterized membrane protein YsdA (DUF1294 family)